ncbi:aminotransferase DegT, partial [bacterium]|nr:aminotransferase DegT [bacterium]
MAEKEIKLSVPNLNLDIVENLKECIETGWVSTGGHFIQQFEKDFSAYVN